MTLQRYTHKWSNVSVPARHKHFKAIDNFSFVVVYTIYIVSFVRLSKRTEIAPIRQMFNQIHFTQLAKISENLYVTKGSTQLVCSSVRRSVGTHSFAKNAWIDYTLWIETIVHIFFCIQVFHVCDCSIKYTIHFCIQCSMAECPILL